MKTKCCGRYVSRLREDSVNRYVVFICWVCRVMQRVGLRREPGVYP